MDYLQLMCVFVKVVDFGSFVWVVSVMDIFNVVVMCYVVDLEGWFGMCLFNCIMCSFFLMELGQVYLECVCQIFDEFEDVEQMVVVCNYELVGMLCIVVLVVFGLYNFVFVLQLYMENFLKVVLDFMLVDWQVDFVEEGFDVGIVVMCQMCSVSIVMWCLIIGCMIVCVMLSYLEKYGVLMYLEQFVEYLVLSLLIEYWGDECVFMGLDGEVCVCLINVIVVNNIVMLCQFVLFGMGVVILLSYLIGSDIVCGVFVWLLLDFWLLQVEINIVYLSWCYLLVKVCMFIDYFVEYFSYLIDVMMGEQWVVQGVMLLLIGVEMCVEQFELIDLNLQLCLVCLLCMCVVVLLLL